MSDEHIKVLREYRARTDCPRERAALDAAIAALGGGWLPIESAPKDGTRVLVADPMSRGYTITVARFWSNNWWTRNLTDYAGLVYPTHWMPLPAPPSKEG